MANGMTYEQLADGLNKQGFWKSVSGFQKVHFNRRYALVVEDVSARNKLVESGLNIDGRHIMFSYHRGRVYTRVLISQLPIGISELDLREIFSFYGEILQITYVTKIMYGRGIDTGDRVLIFKKIDKHVPSYVFGRSWKAFIEYAGQPQTCRICGLTGHIAKDCARNKGPSPEGNKPESEDYVPETPGQPEESSSALMEINTVIPPPVGFQTRSNQAGSALSEFEDREEDVQSIDSLDQDQEAENVKGWEKLPESTFSNASLARDCLNKLKLGV